jgi:Glycine transporter
VRGARQPTRLPGRGGTLRRVDDERPQRRTWREGAATRVTVATVVRQVDLSATGTFAVEGAIAGVKDHLDIFGVMVLARVTAFGAGMVRDEVLISDVPPTAVRDRLYIPCPWSRVRGLPPLQARGEHPNVALQRPRRRGTLALRCRGLALRVLS